MITISIKFRSSCSTGLFCSVTYALPWSLYTTAARWPKRTASRSKATIRKMSAHSWTLKWCWWVSCHASTFRCFWRRKCHSLVHTFRWFKLWDFTRKKPSLLRTRRQKSRLLVPRADQPLISLRKSCPSIKKRLKITKSRPLGSRNSTKSSSWNANNWTGSRAGIASTMKTKSQAMKEKEKCKKRPSYVTWSSSTGRRSTNSSLSSTMSLRSRIHLKRWCSASTRTWLNTSSSDRRAFWSADSLIWWSH